MTLYCNFCADKKNIGKIYNNGMKDVGVVIEPLLNTFNVVNRNDNQMVSTMDMFKRMTELIVLYFCQILT